MSRPLLRPPYAGAVTERNGRTWHLVTGLVAVFAVALQFVLILQGGDHVAVEESPVDEPDLVTRVVRFWSYLTIWSNVLVAGTSLALARRWRRDGRVWRALRLNALILCFGGGVVHFFLLRPLLDLNGWDLVADRLLHVVVPLLAAVGWLAFGPRRRITRADLAPFLVIPGVWLVYTLVRGAFVDWYPYPFVDVIELGYPRVLATCVAVGALMLILFEVARLLDGRLAGSRGDVAGSPDAAGEAPRQDVPHD